MIRFAVYDDQGPAKQVSFDHAHLIGKEDLTIPGSLTFEDGIITCDRATSDAAALAIQLDVGVSGRLTLQTCLLPDKEEPYLLDLELARHRLMLLLNKMEQWSLSDLPADHPVMVGFEKARELFTKSLIAPRGGGPAADAARSRLARQSLQIGIEASEALTLLAAERDIALRADPNAVLPSGKGEFPKLCLGCTIYNDRFAEPLQRVVSSTFDFLICPTRWSEIEREEGQRNFTPTDRWIEWAVRTAKLPVVGGPILDFSARGLPRWIHIWENDYKTLRELAYEQLRVVVTRYRRAIPKWIVSSGLNANTEFSLRLEEIVDLTRLAVLTTRKLQPTATVLVEIAHPFGEHVMNMDRSVAPVLYAGILKESGIQFDGFAVRLQMGDGTPGRSSRDLMMLSSMLDILSEFDKPIHIAAIGAPSAPYRGPEPGARHKELHGDPGYWRQPWSPIQQAEWLTRAVSVAISKPYVHSVAWQCLWDSDVLPEMRAGGLITNDGRPKPALKRMGDVSAALRAGKSPTKLPPAEDAADPKAPVANKA